MAAAAAGLNLNKLALGLVILCVLVASAPLPTNAITCSDVASSLYPCLDYLKSGDGAPPDACCEGVRSLDADAATTPDRQAACNCMKSAARGIPEINAAAAAGLPGKCGVSIPYKISASTDCSRVK